MPNFDYKGLDRSGKSVRGSIEADNSRTAKVRLKKDGIYVIDLKDKTKAQRKIKGKKAGHNKGVGVMELSMMTRQLATLLKANIPLVDTLGAVSDQVENEVLSDALREVKTAVNEGAPLYKSLAKYPRLFNKIYVSMCEAGEMSGTLDTILMRLAEFTESQNAIASKVKSAMLYPLLMFVFTGGLLGILFVFVIPKMVEVFESSPELVLPWFTVVVIDVSNAVINHWLVLILGIVGITIIFFNWKKTPSGSRQWDQIILNMPVVGKLARVIAVSRFTRTLSTLLTGGVPMLDAMNIVRNVVNNEILAEAVDNARNNISEGESIAGPLKASGQFPPIVIHMVNIGEKTGELENMLNQVSDSYDFQVKTQIDGLTALLEPLMIILMGCVIGIIVFAIMVPMFEMSSLGG